MMKYIPLVLFIFSWPVLSADIHGRVVRVGVSLDIENYCTASLFFEQACLSR